MHREGTLRPLAQGFAVRAFTFSHAPVVRITRARNDDVKRRRAVTRRAYANQSPVFARVFVVSPSFNRCSSRQPSPKNCKHRANERARGRT
jgi:hypothetical protein